MAETIYRLLRNVFRAVATLAPVMVAHAFAAEKKAELGRELFKELASPPCAVCHTLADAKSEGSIGPNLDELKPDKNRVKAAVSGGLGAMPAYDSLSENEIDAIASYVSSAAAK